jgi:hypothetical protein
LGDGFGWGPAAGDVPAEVRVAVSATFARAIPGTVVKSTASGRVLRGTLGNHPCHVKFYVYPGWRSRLRGALRNTFLVPSRVAREWAALARLAEAGLQPDLRLFWGERRTLGFLTEAVLVTRTVTAPDLEQWARAHGPDRLQALEPLLAAWVDALHRAGHRDRNLDPRNILVVETDGRLQFVKIDSPRSFAVAPGDAPDRWRDADRRRLNAGLSELRRSRG